MRTKPCAGRIAGIASLVLVLLSLPSATAAIGHVQGELTVRGPVSFGSPASSTLLDVYGLVAPKLNRDTSFTFVADSVRLCEAGSAFVVIAEEFRSENPTGTTHECRTLTNVTIETTQSFDPWGYVGIYPDSMYATLETNVPFSAEPRVSSRIASDDANQGRAGGDAEGSIDYAMSFDAPHVLSRAAGNLEATLTGLLKVRGLNLLVSANEGEFRYETGVKDSQGPVVTDRRVSYALLHAIDAHLIVRSTTPIDIVASSTETTVPGGRVEFATVRGSLESTDAEYVPSRDARRASESDHIEGILTTTLTYNEASGAGLLAVEGSLATTSLKRVPVPASPIESSLPEWLPIVPLAAGAVLLSATGGALAYVLRARLYLRLAHRAETLDERLAWVERACEADPENHDTVMWAAQLHHRLGNLQGARGLMERAARLAPPSEGRPDYYLASILIETAADMEEPDATVQEAVVHLERALARTPSLAHEVQDDALFRSLQGPEFEAMLREALSRVVVTTS